MDDLSYNLHALQTRHHMQECGVTQSARPGYPGWGGGGNSAEELDQVGGFVGPVAGQDNSSKIKILCH
jgi:hypothetical protein